MADKETVEFWRHLQVASGLGGGLSWTALGFVLAAVAAGAILPSARGRVRGAVILFSLAIIGLLAAAALRSGGSEITHVGYRWVRHLSLFFMGLAILSLAGIFIFDVLLPRIGLNPPAIGRDLIVAASYIFLALLLLRTAGVELAGIIATSAVVTAVIGFSLQDTLGNIMGGMALQMERSITVGDWVRIDAHEGLVKEIRWRQTSIETRNWDTVVIPNSVLMKSAVVVLGKRTGQPRQRRTWVYFNVDFRHAPSRIIETVREALGNDPIDNVAIEPPPNVVLMDYKESMGAYAVRYWLVDLSRDDPTSSAVRGRIYAALGRIGIRPSIPAQSVFLTSENQQRRERKEKRELQKRLDALSAVELFSPLTEAERLELAGRLRAVPFTRGEAIVRQGDAGDQLYIIASGEAEVQVAVAGSPARVVAQLREGNFVGEMALLTGEPRSATVVALGEVHCYALDHDGFTNILKQRPAIAADISALLARRRVELAGVREQLTEEARHGRVHETQRDLLGRIRSFFDLLV
ncbi:MAG: mechanosensitive ion channel family protein [Phycisphaerales bacterium]|nr:mechanosensitive ion channel family protein [Phycisphaerales bacterium]